MRPLLATSSGAALGAALVHARARADRWYRGRVALITGGSRGLGLALARGLVARGCRVALVARDGEELRRATASLPSRRALAITGDVCLAADVRRAVAATTARFGRLDVLIHDAGVIQVGGFEDLGEEELRVSLDTHVVAAWNAVQAALPWLERARGRVIAIASIGGLVGLPHLSAYCAGKAALVGFADALRPELAARGVRVTTVCPWLMRTGSARHALFVGDHRREHAWFRVGSSLPLLTQSARRAAERILRAGARGAPRLIPTPQAKLAYAGYVAAPRVAGAVLAAVARRLPRATRRRGAPRTGSESASRWAPSLLTRMADRAGRRLNEGLPDGERVAPAGVATEAPAPPAPPVPGVWSDR